MNNSFRVPFRASGGMPEYRSQTIGPQPGANASARLDDSAGRIVSGQAMRNAEADARGWERFNRGLQGFLKTGVGLYNQYRDKTSRSLVDDALLRAREEMETWRSEYEKTHRGKDGLTAEADYNQAWGRISKAHMKSLREQGVSGPYEHLADLHLRENGLRYNQQGGAFQQQQHKAWNTSIYEGQKDELVREVQRDPDNAQWHGFLKGGVLETYKRLHPGEDTSKLENDLDRLIAVNSIEARIAAQDFEGAQRDIALFSGGGTGGNIGDRVAAYESGNQGVKAVGYDRNGGTSYGKYQLSSKQGSYGEWIDHLAKQGPEGKAAAERLRAAGALDTGGRSGAAVDAYTKEAEANPELFERTQREYVEQTHYQPMLAKLPAELRRQVEGNAGLQEMAWSTAVQHGGAGGARILSRVWKEGMSDGDLVDAVYTARGDNFPSSTPEVRTAVQNRFGRERMQIRGMLRGAALSPEKARHYLDTIRVEENRQRAEAQIDLGSRIEDSIAAWNTGQSASDAPQKDEILAAFGPEKGAKVWDRLKTAQQFGADLQTVSSLAPAQQDALLQQRKPSPGDGFAVAQESWESLVQAVKSDRAYRDKDPVGYLLQKDSSVRSAFEAWEQSPTPENTRGYVRSLLAAGDIRGMERSEINAPPVLPDAAAARLAAKIMDSANPAQSLAQQAAIWGDYWPSVERQLVTDNKLPGTLRLVANMDVDSGEMLAATARNPKYLEEARASLGMATSDFSAFTQKVFDRMEPLLKTVAAQGDLETETVLRDGATRLALEYMLRGYSDSDAAEKAAQEISGKRYGYGEGRDDGGTYRIPITRNVNAVRAGAAQELRSIAERPESLALPGMKGVSHGWLGRTVADTIQREGAWVTAPDESGLLLFVGGYPVKDANGNPVFRSWQEMETTGAPLLMQEDTTLRFLGIESEDLS